MKDPYSVLGVKPGADIESIRAAYHARAKMCHPDLVQDADKKQEAQEQLVELNLAYEAALRIAVPYQRSDSIYSGLMSLSQAKQLAKNQLKQGNARTALRNLLRAEQKDAEWHHLHGSILLMLGDYDAAHLAFLSAISLEPENPEHQRGALDAAIGKKESRYIHRRILRFLSRRKGTGSLT